MVVLSGAVTVVDHEAGVVRELATVGPGRFVNEHRGRAAEDL